MNFKNVLLFVAGAAIGAGSTYLLLNKKFNDDVNKEVSEMREYYAKKKKELEKNEEHESDVCEEPKVVKENKKEFKQKKANEYKKYNSLASSYSSDEDGDKPGTPQSKANPNIKVVSPDEYASKEHYELVDLMYYKGSDTLTDYEDNIIDKPTREEYVGDALNHFGDYEDDAVHVENKDHETYYEILLDLRTYDQAMKDNG